MMKCILMNKNTPVLLMEYDTDFYKISNIYEIYNIEYAPFKMYATYKNQKTGNLLGIKIKKLGICWPQQMIGLKTEAFQAGAKISVICFQSFIYPAQKNFWIRHMVSP